MFDQPPTTLQELIDFSQKERDQVKRDLNEISMLVEQSQSEVERLTKRNAAVNNRLLQLEQVFDTIPRSDIKSTYEAATDAQPFPLHGRRNDQCTHCWCRVVRSLPRHRPLPPQRGIRARIH